MDVVVSATDLQRLRPDLVQPTGRARWWVTPVASSYGGYTRVRVFLGCESNMANVIAAVVAPSQHVFEQSLGVDSPPVALALACMVTAKRPCSCTVVATLLTLQPCAVVRGYLDVHESEEVVEGMMSGHG
jgi:hypothetical protein